MIEGPHRRAASADFLVFDELPGGLKVARVAAAGGRAEIALQGAQVLGFAPAAQAPLLWLSPAARFAPGKAIRGGVPICWPWFGPHEGGAAYPAHGVARTAPWRVIDAGLLDDGRARLRFELEWDAAMRALWPWAATPTYTVTVGETLELELATRNDGDAPLRIGQALHAYFAVGDVRAATVAGLDGRAYIDKVAGGARRRQEGAVSFAAETDRVYLGTSGRCEIRDPAMGRRIRIESSGSRSTVVWNPWAEKAARLGDMGPDGHLGMLCVETANAADDVVELAPGATHRLTARYGAIEE